MDTPSRPPLHLHSLPTPIHPYPPTAKQTSSIPLHHQYSLARVHHTSSPSSPAPTTDALYASLYPTAVQPTVHPTIPTTHNNFTFIPQNPHYAIPSAYTWLPQTNHTPLQSQFLPNTYGPSPATTPGPASAPATGGYFSRAVFARSTDSFDQFENSCASDNFNLQGSDHAGEHAPGQPYRCEYCDKVYTGKHARSIWRRHLSDKHQIPLSSQPRRTRWDNADSNRPKTEEERRARTLESKRRWARKNRAEKKIIRQAGYTVPKSAKDISQLAVQLGFVEGTYGDGSESGSESEEDGSVSGGKGSNSQPKARKREGGSDGGFDVERCVSTSGTSHLAVPEAPAMARTSSAPCVMGSNNGPLHIRVPSPSTLTVPAMHSAASTGTSASVCDALRKRWQGEGWDSSSDVDAEDEDGREAGDALVALKRSAAKPIVAENQWTDYEVPLRDSAPVDRRTSRPASRMSLVSASAHEEDVDEGPSFASSSGSTGLIGSSFGLDRAGDSSPCTSPDGSVAGKSLGSKVKREWLADDDNALLSNSWSNGSGVGGQKRSKVFHSKGDEACVPNADGAAGSDYSSFFGPGFEGTTGSVAMETPARPAATRPRPSPGLDRDGGQAGLAHGGTGFSSPVVSLDLCRPTQANYGYAPQLTAHKPRLSGIRGDASEDDGDLSSCGPTGSSSVASWSSLRTPGYGVNSFAGAGFPMGSSPALPMGLASMGNGRRPSSGAGVKKEGDCSNLFSSPAHANFSRSLGLAPVGGYSSAMDDVLMRMEPLGTPAHTVSKTRETR